VSTAQDIPAEARLARDIANICATGYERHIRDHGPDDSRVVIRLETLIGGAFVVERGGMQFAVTVVRQGISGPLASDH
jgi:hypothetical protein